MHELRKNLGTFENRPLDFNIMQQSHCLFAIAKLIFHVEERFISDSGVVVIAAACVFC